MGGLAQHVDIRTRTEHAVQTRGHDNRLNGWMFKPHALQSVMQFHVYTQIIGIKLQRIAGANAALFIHCQGQGRDITIDIQRPVFIAFRIAVIDNQIFVRHLNPFLPNPQWPGSF